MCLEIEHIPHTLVSVITERNGRADLAFLPIVCGGGNEREGGVRARNGERKETWGGEGTGK